jgi:hypothetical protein
MGLSPGNPNDGIIVIRRMAEIIFYEGLVVGQLASPAERIR